MNLERQMSYMYLVLARGGKPDHGLRLMEIPVEWRGKAFVPSGDMQDRPAPIADLWDMLQEEGDHPMPPVPLPDGWELMAKFWQQSRYVPCSREVCQHASREAVRFMVERGVTTPEQAKRLLENM
jgi:hypothetical protein